MFFDIEKIRIKKELFDEFDFEKIHRVMEALEWKWSMGDGRWATPTVEEIIDKASQLFEELMEGKHDIESTGSGGIRVYFDDEIEKTDCVKMEFILERSISFLFEQ
jgi:hypothetical protein